MRTKEEILNRLYNLLGDVRFDGEFKICLIEVMIDLRTNLKEISEQIKLLRVEPNG